MRRCWHPFLKTRCVAALTIHGRTRAEAFRGSVDLEGIRSVVESVQAMPVFGNGDVCDAATAKRMLEETGCAGLVIGRGAPDQPLGLPSYSGGFAGAAGSARATIGGTCCLYDPSF